METGHLQRSPRIGNISFNGLDDAEEVCFYLKADVFAFRLIRTKTCQNLRGLGHGFCNRQVIDLPSGRAASQNLPFLAKGFWQWVCAADRIAQIFKGAPSVGLLDWRHANLGRRKED